MTLCRLEQLFRCASLMFFVATTVSAQPAADRNEVQRLPDRVLAEWVPVTRTIWEFGNLTLEANSLTWGTCVKVPYRLLRSTRSAWLIELVSSPPCRLVRETSFWLEESEDAIVVSWCADPNEIEKPLLERSCSSGRLKRLSN